MIAVHAGAGYHSPALEAAYKRDLADACRAGATALAAGSDALDAVVAAIRVLEASPNCNAGTGSNLSFNGLVECDASVMAGDGAFGAVAAVPGVQHPVEAAAVLAREGRQPLSHGRVRPMMLAGDRARQWALSRGLAAAETSGDAAAMHLTAHTQRQWRKYRRIVDGATGDEGSPAVGASPAAHHGRQAAGQGSQQQVVRGQEGQQQGQRMAPRPAKRSRRQSSQREESPRQPQSTQQAASEHAAAQSADGCFYDTVGCVALSPDGRVAAGVSSGGIVLKTEGRVGEAAVFGAGCWAQDGSPGVAPTTAAQQQQQQPGSGAAGPCLACSVTGVGERVMQHLLARELCQAAAAGSAAQAAGTPGSAEGEQRLPAEPAEPAEPGLDEVAALLLHRTILLGPPPHDCGLLCLRALPLSCSSSRERGASVGLRQGAQRPQQRRVAVEVAVAHSAQSMAVGHMPCAAAACSTHDGAAGAHGRGAPTGAPPPPGPSVHILRRPVDGGACAAQPVQTYLHGITVHL